MFSRLVLVMVCDGLYSLGRVKFGVGLLISGEGMVVWLWLEFY